MAARLFGGRRGFIRELAERSNECGYQQRYRVAASLCRYEGREVYHVLTLLIQMSMDRLQAPEMTHRFGDEVVNSFVQGGG